ncbi:MAG: hypothetical protein IPP63_05735 [Chloracidobacterium sp.]|nr:hypothetical protein [Chloracidobacterium sp.]
MRLYAAIALVMMDAKPFLSKAVPIVDRFNQQRVFLNMGDFHPFVADRAQTLIDRFNAQLDTAKANTN